MRLKRAGVGDEGDAPTLAPLLPSTRERILTTAERLFAERGLAATSLRTITRQARVNLAAVNYHFGSRDALVEAVCARRLGPLNRARLRQLDRIEGRGAAPSVAEVVAAFVEPIVDLSTRDPRAGSAFVRLLAQSRSANGASARQPLAREHAAVLKRFRAALGRALPQLSSGELALRLRFMLGAVDHAVTDTSRPELERAARELVPFIVAGLKAQGPRQ